MDYLSKEGFRIKAEYLKHDFSWFLWPQRPDVWRLNADPVQKTFSSLVNQISDLEHICVGVNPEALDAAKKSLNSNVKIVQLQYNDAWIRDTGPSFIINSTTKETRGVCWTFNAWGGEVYSDWSLDNKLAEEVCKLAKVKYYKLPLVLEGGSITVDEFGTLIANEQCVLDPKRNPNMTKEEVEEYLTNYLGIKKIIWLQQGVYNDETGGHVHNMCVFIGPDKVVLNWTEDKSDPQYELSSKAYDILKAATTATGDHLEIIKVHQPDPMFITEEEAQGIAVKDGSLPRVAGTRLPASYINFYFGNDFILLPIFKDKHDEAALNTFKQLFPERKIIGVPSKEILLGGGNIHCIALSQP